ncbi:hypothetical protein SCHPADRAFT_891932 [Schizopora paradoxa]|uniref:Uncharacterized protein n=1 Tax=Schizopora paradoxa TaxID=27342 RepID=A0A0H2RHG9_9AGAM|nr:hypothetical protein SCHPADRAFT_891932 [Schizopora paradoxa]
MPYLSSVENDDEHKLHEMSLPRKHDYGTDFYYCTCGVEPHHQDLTTDGPLKASVIVERLKEISNSGLPADWHSTPAMNLIVVKKIQAFNTQFRAKMKKKIKESLMKKSREGDNDGILRAQNLKELGAEMTRNTGIENGVKLWCRYALLRSIFQDDSSDTYWDKVDAHLLSVFTKAKNKYPNDKSKRDDAVHKQLKKVLDKDYTNYGNPLGDEDMRKVSGKKKGSKRARNDGGISGAASEGVPTAGLQVALGEAIAT